MLRSGVFLVNYEHISHFVLIAALNRQIFAGFILKRQALSKTMSGISCLEFYNILVHVRVATNKTKLYMCYNKLGIQFISQVAKRLKT